MFVAIVGTRYSGKSTIENYLVSSKGFTSIRLVPGPEASPADEISEVGKCNILHRHSLTAITM